MKRGSRHLGKITGQHSRLQFHLLLLGSLASYGRWGTCGGGSGNIQKSRGDKSRTISL